jgi:hypothetical protein
LIGPSPETKPKKKKTFEGSPILLKKRMLCLWPTYIGEKEDSFGQSIWDKRVMLLGTSCGTHWELWNLLRT